MKCEEVFSIFPNILKEIVHEMDVNIEQMQEMRVRADRPVLVSGGGREYRSRQTLTAAQVGEILAYISNYSLYAYEEEIRRGFLSLPGGHRVGLAGRTVLEQGRIKTLTEISSLNIRFAHEIKGCADGLLPFLWKGEMLLHTLIVSAPGYGKTTLLRDCIRQISNGCGRHAGKTVGVVDERSEIAGNFRGTPGNDLGLRTDVLDGCPKSEGIMMLIRSMAPEVVAVDEVGSREDIAALTSAMHCGCVLLATIHGGTMEELYQKPELEEMMEQRMFRRFVLLEQGRKPGKIGRILDEEGCEVHVI